MPSGSIASLPQTPDLALILVAARRVPDILRECGEKGVRYAIVYSSGFAEAGEAGAALQRECTEVAAEFGIRVIGPNCQGVVSTSANVYAGFGAPFGVDYRAGGLSLISQSGGFGCALLLMADELGIGLRHFITTGNEADVSLLDLVDACIDDEQTSLIAAYIEGLEGRTAARRRGDTRARRGQAAARVEGRQHGRRREGRRVAHGESGRRVGALSHGVPAGGCDRSDGRRRSRRLRESVRGEAAAARQPDRGRHAVGRRGDSDHRRVQRTRHVGAGALTRDARCAQADRPRVRFACAIPST